MFDYRVNLARRLAEQGGPVGNHGQLSHEEYLGLYLTISDKWRRLACIPSVAEPQSELT
jgi:hypothetical protein